MASVDFAAIGQALQQQYPQYSNSNPETLGQLYVKKYRPADWEAYTKEQSAATSIGEAVTKEKALSAIKNSDEEIAAEVKKATAIDKAKSDLKAQQEDEKTKKARQTILNDTAKNSQQLLDIIDAGEKGKLTGQAYKDALNSASSQLRAQIGFGQAGKAFTGPEMAILGGQMPVVKVREQSLLDKMTGNVPPQQGEVTDDVKTLKRKAIIARDLAQGKKIDINQLQQQQAVQPQSGNIVQNAVTDTKDILGGVLNLGKSMATGQLPGPSAYSPQGIIPEMIRNPQAFKNLLNLGVEGSKQSYQQYKDIINQPGQQVQQHPVNTALALLPFLAVGKAAMAGRAGKAAEAVSVAGNVGEEANQASLLGKVGNELRTQVRQIDVGPQIGGPQREAQINNTLNRLGIKGSPQEQYASLQPVMTKIENEVHAYLDKNAVKVNLDDVKNDLKKNLNNELAGFEITSKDAKKAINGYLSALYEDKITPFTDTNELFRLKQKVNKHYKPVSEKLEKGTPLTNREAVIAVARKTIDDIITEKHPEIKQQTLDQSVLYDAKDSLWKQRKNLMKVRIPLLNNYLPGPSRAVRSGADKLGEILQGL
jgi:hypothetical protein